MFAFPSLVSSLDDIVFEGRNQAYGAYDLRRAYQRHLASAGAIALIGSLLLLGLWAGWHRLHPATAAVLPSASGVIELIEVKPDPKVVYQARQTVMPASQPAAQPRAAALPRAAATPTQVAPDDALLAKATAEPTIADGDPTAKASPEGSTAEANGPAAAAGPETAPGAETPMPPTKELVFAEKMPEFAGGTEALMRYLRKHLRYPSQALAAGVSGRVYLSFVVQADGTISEVTTLKGLGYGLDEEAMRVVRAMPAWTPGQQNKHAVPVRFNLPITFQVQ